MKKFFITISLIVLVELLYAQTCETASQQFQAFMENGKVEEAIKESDWIIANCEFEKRFEAYTGKLAIYQYVINDYEKIIKTISELNNDLRTNGRTIHDSYRIHLNSLSAISFLGLKMYDQIDSLYKTLNFNCKVCLEKNNINNYLITLSAITTAFLNSYQYQNAEKSIQEINKIIKEANIENTRYKFDADMLYAQLSEGVYNREKALEIYKYYYDNYPKFNPAKHELIILFQKYFAALVEDGKQTEAFLVNDQLIKLGNDYFKETKDPSSLIISLQSSLSFYSQNGFCDKAVEVADLFFNNNDLKNYDINFDPLLAMTYVNCGQVNKGLRLMNETITNVINNEGENSEELIELYKGLGLIYERVNLDQSKKCYQKAIELSKLNKNEYPFLYISIANIYRNPNFENINIDSALSYTLKAKNAFTSREMKDSILYTSILDLLSDIFYYKGKFEISLQYANESQQIIKRNYSKEDNYYLSSFLKLQKAYLALRDTMNANKIMTEMMDIVADHTQKNINYLITNIHNYKQIINYSDYFKYHAFAITQNKSLIAKAVNYDLKFKNVQLQYHYSDKLNNKGDKRSMINQNLDIKSIAKKLNKDEAYINFISHNYVREDYKQDKLYYAVIINSNSENIQFVPLCLESTLLNLFNQKRIKEKLYNDLYSFSETSFYGLIFKPMIPFLNNISTIYITTDGILHNVNINAIALENNLIVDDKYKIIHITSLSSIGKINIDISSSKPAENIILYGGINYGKTKLQSVLESSESLLSLRTGVNGWNYLPGTLNEITLIKNIFNCKSKNVIFKSANNATEEYLDTIQKSIKPYFLHIATHGYYTFSSNNELSHTWYRTSDDNRIYENPLNFCGLVLSNGNKNWTTKYISAIDKKDGVLTGYELSQYNLSNCKLAVLSACETGLGERKGSEGVFGMHRALKMAGVENCIVSLWKVPDNQTAELFAKFYESLLNGQSIRESLVAARKFIRKKYPSPFFWAAFVLVE
jgi:CHAT domain-containing protein